MKYLKTIFALSIALAVLFSSTALADEPQQEQDLGIISGVKIIVGYDSFFYKAKLFFEKVRLTNAFTQAGKANVAGIFAKRRIAEAQLMIEKDLLNEAQELIITGIGYISEATAHVGEALFVKDNARSRKVLENISNIQSEVLQYLNNLESEHPNVFDTQAMADDLDKTLADTIVLWSYLSYKDNFLGNPDMRARALEALEEEGFQLDAVSSATADIIMGQDELVTDAITSATYSLMEENGTAPGDGGIDAISTATPENLPPETVLTDGVDAVSSATTTTDPNGGQPTAPTDGGGVDAVSSATPSSNTGTSTAQPPSPYDDDDHDEDDDEHEEEHDDD